MLVRRELLHVTTCSILISIVGGVASTARADSIRWNNPASGIFSAGANWFGGLAPGSDDTAIIDVQDFNEDDYTVTVDTTTTVGGLNVSTLTGGLEIPGVGFTVTGAATLSTGPVTAINANTTFGSLSNATDLTLKGRDGNNVFTVNGNAVNSSNLLFSLERVSSNSFFKSTANFNGGLTNSSTIAHETNGGNVISELNVTGVFDNNSLIENRSAISQISIAADTFNNNGTIRSTADALIGFSRSGATFNNAGLISSGMSVGFLDSFHNKSTGQIDNRFFTVNGTGTGATFINDGSINLVPSSGNLTINAFQTGTVNTPITANSVTYTAGFTGAMLTNNSSISSTTNTNLNVRTYVHKSGATVAGGGSLALAGNLEMEDGFAPGFTSISLGPGTGTSNVTVSGSGALEVHNITMDKWVTFDAGTSLDFTGQAIFRANNSNSSSTQLTLNAPLEIDPGARFRLQANNGFSGAQFNDGLTNRGEFWIETSKPFAGGINPSITARVLDGLINHGTIEGRPRSGVPFFRRRITVFGGLENHGTIINNDNATALDMLVQGGTVNNYGLVDAAGGDMLFSFINTFNNMGEVHAAAGRTVTVSTGTSSFVNAAGGTVTGSGTLVTEGSFVDNGTIAPGDSPGKLTIEANSYMQGVDGVLELEVMGLTAGTEYDQLMINSSNAVLQGTLRLVFLDDFLPEQGHVFNLIVGPATIDFHTVELVNLAPGFEFDLGQENGVVSLTALNDARAEIPEPASCLLLLCGVLFAACRGRRNKKSPGTIARARLPMAT